MQKERAWNLRKKLYDKQRKFVCKNRRQRLRGILHLLLSDIHLLEYLFCSRLCNDQSVYNSAVYWTRLSATMQHCERNAMYSWKSSKKKILFVAWKMPCIMTITKRNYTTQTGLLQRFSAYPMDDMYDPYVPQYVNRSRSGTSSPVSEDDLFEEQPSRPYEELVSRKRSELPETNGTSASSLHMVVRKPLKQVCREAAGHKGISRELALPVTADGQELLKSVLEGNLLSLSKLGKVLHHIQQDAENKESLIHKMNNASINLEHIARLQENVNTLPHSSDSIVRSMTSIVREQTNVICGLSIAMDVALSRVRELEKQVQRTRYHLAKNKSKSLPENCGFSRSNITKTWNIKAQPPFKEINMISIFESWKRPVRSNKHDHYLHLLDFYRHFFLNACDPIHIIQHYAYRQSGKNGKDKSLKDLPESMVTFLIDFVLDAMGLFGDELLLPPADCARIHGRYWAALGETESQRRKRFDALSEARTDWSTHAREALCRALADIRQYEFDAARLTLMPPKKKRVITTQEGTTIEKTELRESPEED
ncbi:unnamed protein product [Cylicocyclus nassatus]|uniref:Uncharacterized protein n=1 Tax=Cylicocyclus nassatus TaxID=53992 RepID=A0AA36MD65_CYLNA|nr:unnamed protein product [Cylicocyclus nassatus]